MDKISEQEEGLKELGIVVEDKEDVFWKEMRDKAKNLMAELERQVKFNKAIMEMCEEKLKDKIPLYVG